MKPIQQSIFDFEHGDCFRACVASIFELPLSAIPNFMEEGPEFFWDKLSDWTNKFNLKALDITFSSDEFHLFWLKDVWVIAMGKSPRNANFDHCVVWYNGKMKHDPHPDNLGTMGEPHTFTVFIVKNLSRMKEKEITNGIS